jgi:hypothetical protein
MGIFNIDIDSLNQRLYMSYYGGDWIMRSNLTGSPLTTIYDGSNGVGSGPLDLKVDPQGRYLYWVNQIGGSVQRARVNPFNATPVTLISGLINPTVIALVVIPEPGTSGLVFASLSCAWMAIGRRR